MSHMAEDLGLTPEQVGLPKTEGEERMSYIARKSCGCVIAAIVDVPDMRHSLAKEVPRWIEAGYTVERVNTEYVRTHLKSCKCGIEQGKLF